MVLVPRAAPKISFGSKCRENRGVETPGPGHYSSSEPGVNAMVFTRAAKANFGTSTREGRQRPSPGPGSYASEGRCRGPAYSCSPRRVHSKWMYDGRKRDAGPGPGAYDQAWPTFLETPKYSIGAPVAMKIHDTPGPGHYGESSRGPVGPSRLSKSYGFGTSPREPGNIARTPGPGHYTAREASSGPKYSLSARPVVTMSREQVPGPGAHDMKLAFAS
eukprot:TRINITY_DN38245_c0_g2_i1.p1 TRINITY_DN38245_c0_g2~~TRINITY_DN38245_c0_g2_i1.p1  ORF type:complete len:218 (+),score=10.25 TRINITY_DN38245_c0_g2_i1:55-708(+)